MAGAAALVALGPSVVLAVAHAPAGAGQRRAPRRVAPGRTAVDGTSASSVSTPTYFGVADRCWRGCSYRLFPDASTGGPPRRRGAAARPLRGPTAPGRRGPGPPRPARN